MQVYEKAPDVVLPGKDVVHAWRGPGIAEAAVAAGIDVVTSHGYYLTAGDSQSLSVSLSVSVSLSLSLSTRS